MIINHSGIALLSCPRRYQLRVLYSIKDSGDSDPLMFGNAMHSAIEAYHLAGRTLANYNIEMQAMVAADKYKLKPSLRGKLIGAIHAVLPTIKNPIHITLPDGTSKPLVEWKMSFDLDTNVTIQGTLDEVHLNANSSAIIVNDYKSTGYMTIEPVREKYSYSLQLPFYMWMLNYSRSLLPAAYCHLPLMGTYTVVQYNKSPATVNKLAMIQPEDDVVADIISHSINMITNLEVLHSFGEFAPMIGRTSNQCKDCGMKHICFSKKPIMQAIEEADKETYDPMKFR